MKIILPTLNYYLRAGIGPSVHFKCPAGDKNGTRRIYTMLIELHNVHDSPRLKSILPSNVLGLRLNR